MLAQLSTLNVHYHICMLKAWAQLVRLPNVFTAPADVIAGAALAGCLSLSQPALSILLLNIIASVCLYAAGMIMNDLVDLEIDQLDRPERPLPSRCVEKEHALAAMLALLVVGGYLASNSLIVLTLSLMIIAYNLVLKHTFAGPLAMGACRGFNLMLGAAHLVTTSGMAWWGFWTVTAYITGVTIMARDETVASQKSSIRLGIIVIFMAKLSLAAMAIRQYLMTEQLHLILLLTLLAVMAIQLVVGKFYPAYMTPNVAKVQAAVKAGIMGLVLIEAFHTMIGIGYPGLLVVLLLIPALYLGRFIYST